MRLLSHNVFWLQGVPFDGTDPETPVERVVAGLCGIYDLLSPDLLLLQEIHSDEALSSLTGRLGLNGTWFPGRLLPQYGVAMLGGTGWKARGWAELGLEPVRSSLLAELEGLEIACVHLPSGRQMGKEQAAEARVAELKGLLSVARPGVICGDMNERPGGGVCDFLRSEQYVDVVAERLGEPVCSAGGYRVDYVWVVSGLTGCVVSVRTLSRDEMTVHGKLLSDHFPIVVDLEV